MRFFIISIVASLLLTAATTADAGHRRFLRCHGCYCQPCDGPVQKGPVQKGPVQKSGPVQKGPVQKGAVQKGDHHHCTVIRCGLFRRRCCH